MQDNTDQMVAFQRRSLHTRREWRDLAQAYVDAQALKHQARDDDDDDDDDTESDSGDDTFDPIWPAIEAQIPQLPVIPQPAMIPPPAVMPPPASSISAIPSTFIQLSMNQALSGSSRDSEISQHGLGSPVRTTMGEINGDKNSIQTACKTIRKKVFSRQPLFKTEIYQGEMVSTSRSLYVGVANAILAVV